VGDAPAHVPVLLARCLELLDPALRRPGAVAVDATLGLGGHAEAMLQAHPGLTVLGLDRDPQALAMAAERLAPFGSRFQAVRAVYDTLPVALAGAGHRRADAILFDLGVSSMQLDLAERGFAYATDAPLDMRMDPTAGATAADLLNTAPAAELARILRTYGEERFASQLARAIVRERERAPFTTSARLVALVRDTIPAPARRTGGNPAKRTFQALRIEVNAELSTLAETLPAVLDRVAVAGRVVVLAYHSLEDRLVKQALAAGARSTSPPDLPVELPGHGPVLRLLTKGAERPDDAECEQNARASSARLRAAERIAPGAVPRGAAA
jgi:16S rRNA (cytosine1402-N4)-methyltransferase